MALHAKLFQNGGSQAVRLPKDCRFPEGLTEVLVHRKGQQIILEPADSWPTEFLEALGSWSDEIERLKQEPISKLGDPFE